MAITFEELHDRPGAEGQATPFGTVAVRATRRFKVPGYDDVDVLAHASLPLTGSSHPSQTGLLALAPRSVQRIGSGNDSGWIVEVPYAPTRFGDGGPIDPPDITEGGYKAENLSFATERKRIPYFVGRKIQVPIFIPPYTTVPFYNWTRTDFEVPLRKMIYRVRCNVAKSAFNYTPIANQFNKVHSFGGYKWLYQGADVDERENGMMHLIHQWITEDTVTPDAPAEPADGETIYVAPPVLPPFHDWIVRWVEQDLGGGPQKVPTFLKEDDEPNIVSPYDEDLTGYSGLPGAPL